MNLKREPIYPSNLTPQEIIGLENEPILEAHFKLTLKESDAERLEKLLSKNYTEAERAYIQELYEKLRSFGIYPKAIDKFGAIIWGISLKSDLQTYIESKYPLKCDNCNCQDGVCEGYNREQIDYFKYLARTEKPISTWPKKIFNW